MGYNHCSSVKQYIYYEEINFYSNYLICLLYI